MSVGAAAVIWMVIRGWDKTTYDHADFYDFYWGAHAARHGTDMYQAGDGGYIYPPLLGVLMIPLTFLSPQPAMKLWIVLCALLLVWCVWKCVKVACEAFDYKTTRLGEWTLSAMTLLVLADSFRGEFEWANSNIVMLCGIVLGLAWLRKRPALAGAAIAFACAIKYLPIAFLPYFLVRRQWRAAAGMVTGLAACAMLPALWLGWEKNASYLATALRGMAVMSGATTTAEPAANVLSITRNYSLSITSGIARMLGPDRSFSSLAMWTAAALALAVMVAWTLYRTKGVGFFTPHVHIAELKSANQSPEVSPREKTQTAFNMLWFAEYCAVLAAALAFAPQTQKRHFNLLVPLIAGLVVIVAKLPGKARIICITALLAFAAGVTPMPNIPGLRTFIDDVWKWGGGPGWLVIAVSFALVWIALSRTTPHTSDHV
ncbi:MAG: glycosyltransferase family 87 protein [Phycisphaerales bacterium]